MVSGVFHFWSNYGLPIRLSSHQEGSAQLVPRCWQLCLPPGPEGVPGPALPWVSAVLIPGKAAWPLKPARESQSLTPSMRQMVIKGRTVLAPYKLSCCSHVASWPAVL